MCSLCGSGGSVCLEVLDKEQFRLTLRAFEYLEELLLRMVKVYKKDFEDIQSQSTCGACYKQSLPPVTLIYLVNFQI